MIFIYYPARLCRNISCVSTSKLCLIRHSTNTNTKKLEKPVPQELPQITIGKNYQARSSIVNIPYPVHPDIPLTSKTPIKKIKEQDQVEPKTQADTEWREIKVDPSKLLKHCMMLSKIRLTTLVVITSMGGYALAPAPFDIYTFLMCSIGTGLLSGAANAINQFFEVPFDSQMSRTKNRVLVRGYLTPAHAAIFATVSGTIGLSLLYSEVNGVTAALGAINLILYTLIYTPMKRFSILNTWVGSVVGAIPPLMGWAGCIGDITAPGAWIMSGILYAWQFPHFNALSWNLRPDYSRAGYRMMAVTNPDLCRATTLRYTAALSGLCYLAPVLDVTHWWFAVASTPLNAYFLYLAWQFNKNSDSASSRKLFRFSLVHLPVLMLLMLVSKKYWFTGKNMTDTSTHVENKQKKIFDIFTRLPTATTSVQ